MKRLLSRSIGIIFVLLLLNCSGNKSSLSEIDNKYLSLCGRRIREIGESSSVFPIDLLELSQNTGDKAFEKWLIKNKDYIKMPLKGQPYHTENPAHLVFEFTPPYSKATFLISAGGAFKVRDN